MLKGNNDEKTALQSAATIGSLPADALDPPCICSYTFTDTHLEVSAAPCLDHHSRGLCLASGYQRFTSDVASLTGFSTWTTPQVPHKFQTWLKTTNIYIPCPSRDRGLPGSCDPSFRPVGIRSSRCLMRNHGVPTQWTFVSCKMASA